MDFLSGNIYNNLWKRVLEQTTKEEPIGQEGANFTWPHLAIGCLPNKSGV